MVILDGWGIDRPWGGNAVTMAKTPAFNFLCQNFPHSQLKASAEDVGLPPHARGNSEAGHLNIGAGRIVHQDIEIINDEINKKTFFSNRNLNKAIEWALEHKSNLHLIGLLGDGGNHSDIKHLFALIDLIASTKFKNLYLHLITDGRDTNPESAQKYIKMVEEKLESTDIGKIASISGRYYAMDRDNRWGRTSRYYNALVEGAGETYVDAETGILNSYANHVSDEFIIPFLIADKGQLKTTVKNNDSIILFNFRTDRIKQLVRSFVEDNFHEFLDRKLINNLFFVTFMPVEENLPVHSAFGPEKVSKPIAWQFSQLGLKQFHIAETEKYAHVTYFFDGQLRERLPGETYELVPSPKVLTYDLAPKMSAVKVKEVLLNRLSSDESFYLVNFANPDMVGHSGNLAATIQAVEEVDRCLADIINAGRQKNLLLVVCADHGNAEKMLDIYSGEKNTEHTTNPVPLIFADFSSSQRNMIKLKNGRLSDLAPTILGYLNLTIPKEMSGKNLIEH